MRSLTSPLPFTYTLYKQFHFLNLKPSSSLKLKQTNKNKQHQQKQSLLSAGSSLPNPLTTMTLNPPRMGMLLSRVRFLPAFCWLVLLVDSPPLDTSTETRSTPFSFSSLLLSKVMVRLGMHSSLPSMLPLRY